MADRPESVADQNIAFVRSAPLSVTPAVDRYAQFLRSSGFAGAMWGVELNFQNGREPPPHFEKVFRLSVRFGSVPERLWALVRWQFYLTWQLVCLRPSVIQYSDAFSALPALLASRFVGSRLVFDIRDNARMALSHWGILGKVAGIIEDAAALRSDAVVVVSEPLRRELPARAQKDAIVVPNAPGRDAGRPVDRPADGALRVNLAGFVSWRRNLRALCEAAAASGSVHLDIYGAVADSESWRILREYGFGEVVVLPHRAALERMAEADVVALMYDPGIEINRFAAPNKYYEALMLGKPIVCAKGMRMESELENRKCGVAVEYGDVGALVEVFARLSEPECLAEMSANARFTYEELYATSPHREMDAVYRRVGVLR